GRYMPRVYRDAKQKEFLALKQGTMTVAQYEVKFTQLSYYHVNLVQVEEDKCTRFEDGLNMKIRKQINLNNLQSYTDLRDAAI
ncbi:hypothetical protein J0J30_24170, partial [Vibrio vulnificus]|nr:hypothetical protein [Vibrio vulnificus]